MQRASQILSNPRRIVSEVRMKAKKEKIASFPLPYLTLPCKVCKLHIVLSIRCHTFHLNTKIKTRRMFKKTYMM